MNEEQPKDEGMKMIWKIVLATMVFTIAGGMLWHVRAMYDLNRVQEREASKVKKEIVLLRAYRDAFAKDGIESAKSLLTNTPH